MISISGGIAATYIYDYQGRRSSKTVSGATMSYLYDGLNLVREAGSSPAEYLFGPGIDEPLAMSRSGQVYYYGVDGLGSVNVIADAGGAVQRTYLHDAWGQLRNQTGTLANPFGYTAREPAGDRNAILPGEVLPAVDREVPLRRPTGLGPANWRWSRRSSLTKIEAEALLDLIPGIELSSPGYEHPDRGLAPPTSDDEVGALPAYSYVFNDPIQFVDPSGEVVAGAIAPGAAAAAGIAWRFCKNIRCTLPRYDPPTHTFPLLGRRCHIQMDCYIKGQEGKWKGSHSYTRSMHEGEKNGTRPTDLTKAMAWT